MMTAEFKLYVIFKSLRIVFMFTFGKNSPVNLFPFSNCIQIITFDTFLGFLHFTISRVALFDMLEYRKIKLTSSI
jgi:hypothetical protein